MPNLQRPPGTRRQAPAGPAFHVSPFCIQKYALSAGRANNARTVIVAALVRSSRTWAVEGDVLGSYAGLGLVFSRCWLDQSGPRDASLIRLITRSPSSRSDRGPMTEMSGSEPRSNKSSSRKVRRGRYSGPLSRRSMDHACSPSLSRRGSSSAETSFTLAWG